MTDEAVSALPRASRIVLVTPGLAAGGTERVVSTLANWWASAGHRVSIVTLDGAQAVPFFPLDPRIELVRLDVAGVTRGAREAILGNVSRVRALRAALAARPGFLLSFIAQTNLLVLLAMQGGGRPVVVAERTDPSMAPLPWIWRRLRRLLYRRAAAVVVQTSRVKTLLERTASCRAVVIPNPVTAPTLTTSLDPDGRQPDVISVGRFTEEKGFDLLIRAFATLGALAPPPRLRLVGDGPLRAELQGLATTLGIASRVEWLGQRRDVAELLARGDVYVLASRFEGFPNVLCEAMAAGAPVIAFDCRSGPAEIVSHDTDGLLVPPEDVPALAAAMRRLLTSADDRRRLGSRARDLAIRLSPQSVIAQWETVLLATQLPQ